MSGAAFSNCVFWCQNSRRQKIWCIGHGSLQWVASSQETRHFIKAVIYGKGRMVPRRHLKKLNATHIGHWAWWRFFCNFCEITCNWYTCWLWEQASRQQTSRVEISLGVTKVEVSLYGIIMIILESMRQSFWLRPLTSIFEGALQKKNAGYHIISILHFYMPSSCLGKIGMGCSCFRWWMCYKLDPASDLLSACHHIWLYHGSTPLRCPKYKWDAIFDSQVTNIFRIESTKMQVKMCQ